MIGQRWTLHIARGKGREKGKIRQYRISPRAFCAGLVGLTAALLTLVGLSVHLAMEGPTYLAARRLASENRVLSAEFERVRERVANLEASLESISDKDAQLRLLAGLESIDEEILQVGVGGPGFETPEGHPLWSVDTAASKAAFAVTYDLNFLERRARLLSESVDEATDSLMAHRDLLESTPSILPTSGLLSSRFSRSRYHPIHHRALPHEGIDIAAPGGTPILATAKGRVVRAEWAVGYGEMVEIDHGYGYVTRYGHASRLLVRPGQVVARGDVIGLVGSTGIATAPHLHYEVRVHGRPQNPMNYVLPGVVP